MVIESWMITAGAAGSLALFMMGVGLALKRFYFKADANEALVRTGTGGTRVVIGGGLLVLPLLQRIARVSLRTIAHTATLEGDRALVTADGVEAACTTTLYLKVDDTEEMVVSAARSFDPCNLREGVAEVVDGKLIDALRSAAVNKTFDELHLGRERFAEHIKKALVVELCKNGLKLESVALTDLTRLSPDADPLVGLRRAS